MQTLIGKAYQWEIWKSILGGSNNAKDGGYEAHHSAYNQNSESVVKRDYSTSMLGMGVNRPGSVLISLDDP